MKWLFNTTILNTISLFIILAFSPYCYSQNKTDESKTYESTECPSEFDYILNCQIVTVVDVEPSYKHGDLGLASLIFDTIDVEGYDVLQLTFKLEIIISSEGEVITSNILLKTKRELTEIESDILKFVNKTDGWAPGYCGDSPVTSRKFLSINL